MGNEILYSKDELSQKAQQAMADWNEQQQNQQLTNKEGQFNYNQTNNKEGKVPSKYTKQTILEDQGLINMRNGKIPYQNNNSPRQQKVNKTSFTYLLFKDQIFYYKQVNGDDKFYIGKLYQTDYDKDNNPKYQIREIIQQNQDNYFYIEKNKVNCYGVFIEYCGKSNIIKQPIEQQLKQNIQQQQQNLRMQSQPPIRRIIIQDGQIGKQLNQQQSYIKKIQPQISQQYCKYNQLISQNDINILNSSKSLMKRSIIDAYVCYLNKQEQEHYFIKHQQDKQIQRTYFFWSQVFTSFAEAPQYFYSNHIETFKQEILEFQELNYQIDQIYKTLVFVINQQNSHWFAIAFTFNNDQQCYMEIFDSLNSTYQDKIKYQQYFTKLFSTIFERDVEIKIINTQIKSQQSDGYTCGWHTCYYLEQLFNRQFGYQQQSFNQKNITEMLQNIIMK